MLKCCGTDDFSFSCPSLHELSWWENRDGKKKIRGDQGNSPTRRGKKHDSKPESKCPKHPPWNIRHQLLDHPGLPSAAGHLDSSSNLGACVWAVSLTLPQGRLRVTISISGWKSDCSTQPDNNANVGSWLVPRVAIVAIFFPNYSEIHVLFGGFAFAAKQNWESPFFCKNNCNCWEAFFLKNAVAQSIFCSSPYLSL